MTTLTTSDTNDASRASGSGPVACTLADRHPCEPPRVMPRPPRASDRTRRLAGIGNAVVPQVAELIGRWALTGLANTDRLDPPDRAPDGPDRPGPVEAYA